MAAINPASPRAPSRRKAGCLPGLVVLVFLGWQQQRQLGQQAENL